jgi:hypothetical protein
VDRLIDRNKLKMKHLFFILLLFPILLFCQSQKPTSGTYSKGVMTITGLDDDSGFLDPPFEVNQIKELTINQSGDIHIKYMSKKGGFQETYTYSGVSRNIPVYFDTHGSKYSFYTPANNTICLVTDVMEEIDVRMAIILEIEGYKTTTSTQQPKETPKPQNDTKNYDINDTDVGFSPFLAKTTTTANFRTAPSTSSSIIKTLPTGSELYVFSDQDANGFYKVIDVQSGNIGWISKSLVKYTDKVDINYSGAFQSTGKTSTYNSEVVIRNKSSYRITLVVGDQTFYLSPYSTATKSITPARSYYIATAPGVRPTSGYQTFSSYQGYEWEFWVETRRY